MVIAKKFPRNEIQAIDSIKTACARVGLAELAMYSYPRGGQTVTGPSIRLAEVLAQAWGNIDYGIIELEQKDGESIMMAVAWDLQTNTRRSMVFTVPHERKAGKEIKQLTDPRDIYEMTANQGARRLRSCILSIIPIDIQETAIAECEKTLKGANKEPLKDRVTNMVIAFKDNFGVTQEMLEKRLGHRSDAITEQEMVTLRKIYTSLKDGMSKREDWFDSSPVGISTPKQPDTSKSAPSTPEPSPSSGGNQDAQAPTTTKDALYDPEKPFESITSMMKRDSVTDAQVIHYAKGLGLTGKSVTKISEIRETSIKKLCETWITHLPKIQAIPAGE